MDRIVVECGFRPFNHRIMAVDPHGLVIVRHRKGKDLLVNLLLVLDASEYLDDSFHSKRHAVRVLTICDVKCCGPTFHFAYEERKVHVECGHKKE